MNPEDRRARDRFAVLMGLRAGGAALMVLGLWMALGGSVGGRRGFAGELLIVGAVGALVVPQLLARRWRSPK